MPSGSSQRSLADMSRVFRMCRSAQDIEQHEPKQHGAQARETQLAVVQTLDRLEGLSEAGGVEKRQDALQHQEQRQRDAEVMRHAGPAPTARVSSCNGRNPSWD